MRRFGVPFGGHFGVHLARRVAQQPQAANVETQERGFVLANFSERRTKFANDGGLSRRQTAPIDIVVFVVGVLTHAEPAAGSDSQMGPASRASITCAANSRSVRAAAGEISRMTKREVLVS